MDSIPYVILDSSVLTNGMRVMVDGVDTTQFEKNPVMLYDHNDWNLPLGRWENIRKENGFLLADAVFDEGDTDEQVKRIIGKVSRGFLKACTPGLVDLEGTIDPMYVLDCQDGPTITSCRLREVSITPIGKNFNALKLYDKQGKEIEYKENPTLLLSDFIVSPKIETKMDKIYLSKLNLSEKATDTEIDTAIELLLSDKQKADERATNAETELNALKLSDKTAKKSAFEAELDVAFKDGRLSEKPVGDKLTPVRDSMLNLFDKDPEGTHAMLGSIAVPTKLDGLQLGDKTTQREQLEKMSFQDIDKAGKQLLLKDSYPDLYKIKFKEAYGKEPK